MPFSNCQEPSPTNRPRPKNLRALRVLRARLSMPRLWPVAYADPPIRSLPLPLAKFLPKYATPVDLLQWFRNLIFGAKVIHGLFAVSDGPIVIDNHIPSQREPMV
jgi:hypothetical protein